LAVCIIKLVKPTRHGTLTKTRISKVKTVQINYGANAKYVYTVYTNTC